jgi:RNA polymerase sigma factor (sigma-70 family)
VADQDFEQVLREHGPLLSRIAASFEARPAERDDLLQEITLAIWRALPRFRHEAPLRSFVARIAHNRCLDHLVSRQRDGRRLTALSEEIADAGAGPERQTTSSQDRSRLMAAVRQLPVGLRQVVTLALEGFAHAEIAAVLGLEVNTVDVRLSRARRALKDALEEKP